jgi:hypothetical protein
MRSEPVALLLADLSVTKTQPATGLERQSVSKAHFKTLKYCPQFPERFGSIEDGRRASPQRTGPAHVDVLARLGCDRARRRDERRRARGRDRAA